MRAGLATSALLFAGLPLRANAAPSLEFGPAQAFSFDALKQRARAMSAAAYAPPPRPAPDITGKIDYATHGQIRYRPEMAYAAEGPGAFPVTFFHLGMFFQRSVKMHVLAGGRAREIVYRQDYFDMPADSIARKLPQGSGFAGFRVQESRSGELDWKKNDWAAFLGASYFRAIGELHQYGLSARGVAINTANPVPPHLEEFPDFTEFWIEEQPGSADTINVYALMDGPSIAGAYRFVLKRGRDVLMDIDAALFLRKDIARLGIAPLTSMYWFSDTVKPTAVDWRPELHDSDGLALWTGKGERLWRPLNNPPAITVSSFADDKPKGFGLSQRDRAFDHYLDGVRYDLRPTLWVEPLAGFERGAVQLVEMPTDDEIHDNIGAMWVPAEPATAGRALEFRYRLHWSADEPVASTLARCVATRLGNGGVPGLPRPKGVRKFMVEFLGAPLAKLPFGTKPEAVLWASRGKFSYVYTEAVPDDVPGHWRAQFDLTVKGAEPVEMRLYLKNGDETLSETWTYQYHPFGNG
ncbi:MAG TPA: glucan biosynthesis protein D [Burkholderiales bacterium]|nr:glucan biosynthesis protein D [Burkholderiales bacterium]